MHVILQSDVKKVIEVSSIARLKIFKESLIGSKARKWMHNWVDVRTDETSGGHWVRS